MKNLEYFKKNYKRDECLYWAISDYLESFIEKGKKPPANIQKELVGYIMEYTTKLFGPGWDKATLLVPVIKE